MSHKEEDLLQCLTNALMTSTRSDIGDDRFGLDGRLENWSDTLVSSLDPSWFSKLGTFVDRGRFREPHSGQAIALNSFLRWQGCPELLSLAGRSKFRELRFGGRCPTGIRGTPPYLDLIATSPTDVVAVTARAIEYLAGKRSKLAKTYLQMPLTESFEPWRRLAGEVIHHAAGGKEVDIAALIKFAFGLSRTFPNHNITLLYLYWEPLQSASLAKFAAHRAHLERIEHAVANSNVAFKSQSFHELWRSWLLSEEPHWVGELVAQLQARFTVVLDTSR